MKSAWKYLVWCPAIVVLFLGCTQSAPPSEATLLDGVNWAVRESIAAGTHSTGINTQFVPISPGECQSITVLNHYTRTLNGNETYHFYELKGKFAREERTYQIGFVQRGNKWFYRLGN